MNEIEKSNKQDDMKNGSSSPTAKTRANIDIDYFTHEDDKNKTYSDTMNNNGKIVGRNCQSTSMRDLYESKDIFPSHKESMERIKLFFGGSGHNSNISDDVNVTQPVETLSTASTSRRRKKNRNSDINSASFTASQKLSAKNKMINRSRAVKSSIISSAKSSRAVSTI